MAAPLEKLNGEDAKIFNKLIEIATALSAELNHNRLMEKILSEAQGICMADGGTLYLRTDDNKLKFSIMRTVSKGIAIGGESGTEIPFPPLNLHDPETNNPNLNNVASYVAHTKKSVNIPDVYKTKDFDFSGTKEFDKGNGYRSKSFLTVPLVNHVGNTIGVMQLINAQDPETNQIIPFSTEIMPLIEALSSLAAVALEKQILLDAQRALLDSFIELVAGAIDAKSHYTGNHCQRVPVLAKMLAEAACDSTEPIFKDFNLTEEEKYELHIGAWLHDCGKVTTPEYVVDKATKLEAIYDRIHEIRMRFEVLKRDAAIECLEALIKGEEDEAALRKKLDERLKQLDNDFAFIAETNIGGEFMSPEKVEKINKLAEVKWTRTLDDRIGISQDELNRKNRNPKKEPPVEESLLSDRDEHIFLRTDAAKYGENNPHGFKLDVPEHEYNRGEIYNLCIPNGTLTKEDYFKIKDHIMQTIIMLEKLPFPKHLARAPEYASGHHENMINTGYPKKLGKGDMTIPARIMAIADIFEALTAADRPYKKAKKLSESIKILSSMKKDQHIDPDIFELFLKSGVYKTYAEKFLKPEQIDGVDISKYVDS